jgi:hypothetical protein
MKKILLTLSLGLGLASQPATADTWTVLPGQPGGVSNGIIAASNPNHGYIYDGTTFTPLVAPGADITVPNGIDNGNVVGYYQVGSTPHGFIYNGGTFTDLNMPGKPAIFPRGISGNRIVGSYPTGGNVENGIYFDGAVWNELGPGVAAFGIDGTMIVGSLVDSLGNALSGFVYDGTTLTPLSKPGAQRTMLFDISGNLMVGTYYDGSNYNGVIFDGTSWTTLNMPGSTGSFFRSIDGNTLVGYAYYGADWANETSITGFRLVTSIPEPSSIGMLALGAVMLLRRRSRTLPT